MKKTRAQKVAQWNRIVRRELRSRQYHPLLMQRAEKFLNGRLWEYGPPITSAEKP